MSGSAGAVRVIIVFDVLVAHFILIRRGINDVAGVTSDVFQSRIGVDISLVEVRCRDIVVRQSFAVLALLIVGGFNAGRPRGRVRIGICLIAL